MDFSIQAVSIYNNELGVAGFNYELNLVKDGKILHQKSLLTKGYSFNSNNPKNTRKKLSTELQAFIDQVKKDYKVNSLVVNHRATKFLEKELKQVNKDIQFNAVFDPKIFSSKIALIYEEMKSVGISIEPLKNKSKKSIDFNKLSIDEFLSEMKSRETAQQELFKNTISKNPEINDVYIDFAYTLEKNRKRTGVLIEYFKTEESLRMGKDQFHRSESIGHGEVSCAMYAIKRQLKDSIEELLSKDKKVTINVNLKNSYLKKSFNVFLEQSNLLNKVTIINKGTALYKTAEKKLESKINKDIEIYIKELSKPETVAVFTDGSVNVADNLSGSGLVIRHQEINKIIASRNENQPDSVYAEFKAIVLGLREIAHNPVYKGKRIMIVSDNDLMSYSIRNKLNNIGSGIDRPYIDEICDLIKDNNMDIYFHNVKSHVYKSIPKKLRAKLIDFHYNITADLLAGGAAGHKLTAKQEEIILDQTADKLDVEKRETYEKLASSPNANPNKSRNTVFSQNKKSSKSEGSRRKYNNIPRKKYN